MKHKINYGKTTLPLNIKKVEEKYGAKYIGDFCLRVVGGGWSEAPAAVFFQPNPDRALGHTNYFGLIFRGEQLFITKGDSAFSEPIQGIVSKSGEVLYSRFRHDFRTLKDGSGSIDGGRDYTKVIGSPGGLPDPVTLVIKGAKLVVQDPEVAPEPKQEEPETEELVEMQTSELVDEALDWAVCQCEGREWYDNAWKFSGSRYYHPSTDWSHGGPIVERMVKARCKLYLDNNDWPACHNSSSNRTHIGPTPLIAAMRCYVASTLGDVVKVPAHVFKAN